MLDLALSLFGGLSIVRAVLGVILVFWLPGFAWSLVFFREVTRLERLALSLGLSLAIVTLSILLANILFGIRITALNSVLVIVTVTIVPLVVYGLRRARPGK